MATLVLSTVGTVLGGPVGGAIGSLIGQGIDQQLLGPGPREGPRLGDLSVQSSVYGTPIPRIHGTMRVAGSIVWATDLKEGSQTTGAKGQPDSTMYSYSVSFAVAISSRPIQQIGRIWADGKLLRGADGEFKVPTIFRFYAGDEEQTVDPLIAAAEGLTLAPAFRGLSLAVFEGLQLAEFGNRIPFLTFEVEADSEPPSLASILKDVSDGAIQSEDSRTVVGYAAYAADVRSSVEPLVDHFGLQLFDDGSAVRTPTGSSVEVDYLELGSAADDARAARAERSQAAARSLPSVLTLSYYDPVRDYQAAQARAIAAAAGTVERTERLAAVLDASSARALAETSLARRWSQRDKLRLRLPPGRMDLEPGMRLRPPGESSEWCITSVQIDSLVTVADLEPIYSSIEAAPSDPGRLLANTDSSVQPTVLAAIEMPASDATSAEESIVMVATATPIGPWKPVALRVDTPGSSRLMRSAARESIFGVAETKLAPGQSALLDLQGSVDVLLTNPEHWLESRDDEALVAGENLAILGSELFQFGSVEPIGDGRFRLSRLLRGRRGSEWAMNSHSIGERFVVLDDSRLKRVEVSAEFTGSSIGITPGGVADADAVPTEVMVTGEALRPPSPVHLRASIQTDGSLRCTWMRRSRSGWGWLDDVDAPLGCAEEKYAVGFEGTGASLQLSTNAPEALLTAAETARLGAGPITVSVRQIGNLAASRACSIQINTG